MKNFLIIVALVALVSCKKTNTNAIVKGKLVHRSCASIVVEVLDSPFYNLGENTWQQSPSKPVFQHVFTVANSCSFPTMSEGQEFTFKLLDKDPNQGNCYVCAMFDNPPKTKQIIEVVGTTK